MGLIKFHEAKCEASLRELQEHEIAICLRPEENFRVFLAQIQKNFIVHEDFNHERESLLGVNEEMVVFKEMLYILQ